MLGSTPNTGAAKVYLIKVQRNFPTAGDTTLTAVDSVMLTNSRGQTPVDVAALCQHHEVGI